MELNFSTFNILDSVIYRANIFNYDNKFLGSVRELNFPIPIKMEGILFSLKLYIKIYLNFQI